MHSLNEDKCKVETQERDWFSSINYLSSTLSKCLTTLSKTEIYSVGSLKKDSHFLRQEKSYSHYTAETFWLKLHSTSKYCSSKYWRILFHLGLILCTFSPPSLSLPISFSTWWYVHCSNCNPLFHSLVKGLPFLPCWIQVIWM